MLRRRSAAPLGISPTRAALIAAYVVAVLPALMYFNVGLTPDVLIFVLLGAALIAGHARLFVHDWGVFLLVLILWQQTGPVAKWAGFPLHMRQLVNADRFLTWPLLHGALPQEWLQVHLYHRGSWQWYDLLSVVVYGLHFPEPLLVGFAIWLRNRALFRRFAAAFLTLAGLGFAGYIVFPAVPPWMALQYGVIHHVAKIFNEFNAVVLLQHHGHAYRQVIDVDYNKTAAMPSLHAAFPILSALYLNKAYGRWGLLMLVYAAIVWFAVVYMAEHWVIDVAAGAACAVVAYALIEAVAALRAARERPQTIVEDFAPLPATAASSARNATLLTDD